MLVFGNLTIKLFQLDRFMANFVVHLLLPSCKFGVCTHFVLVVVYLHIYNMLDIERYVLTSFLICPLLKVAYINVNEKDNYNILLSFSEMESTIMPLGVVLLVLLLFCVVI